MAPQASKFDYSLDSKAKYTLERTRRDGGRILDAGDCECDNFGLSRSPTPRSNEPRTCLYLAPPASHTSLGHRGKAVS